MTSPSIYRLRMQDLLAICVMALLALGVLMVQSASMRVTGQPAWKWSEYGLKHILYVGIALAAFFLAGHFDYRKLLSTKAGGSNPVLWLLILSTAACFAVLIPGVGISVNGARRWLSLGFTRIQPSELGKWAIVVFLAWWLAVRPVRIESIAGFVLTLVPVGIVCLLVVIEDLGTAALIGMAALMMLLVGRARLWHLAAILPPLLGAGYWFLRHKEYRWKRIVAFLDPWAYPEREGYHMIQSLMAFATGGVLGKGLGRGVQKLGYLPEDTTDFIFAVIAEELGLFGAMLTIVLYLGILYVAWNAARQAKDAFGRLLAFGIGTTIAAQALINVAVATVSMPTKGMSLPLVSFGGSGLVITSAALGLLYSVCRVATAEETERRPAASTDDAPQLNVAAAQ
ncbi:MAG: putative peptidoglycan glycosyltransferase FtsW [Tepidisphaeraceae bacterium]